MEKKPLFSQAAITLCPVARPLFQQLPQIRSAHLFDVAFDRFVDQSAPAAPLGHAVDEF
jgi:hypothetical protein